MRKINKDFNNAPSELLECAKKHEADLLETKNVNSTCYKKSKRKLESQFYKKCAYCETKYLTTSDTWIEHYRPKSKSEYYWLAYEWSNLLPTCTKCNRPKKDNFPLINEKNKVKAPLLLNGKLDLVKCKADTSPLIDEQPFVLHPKIDNPEKYFDFQIDECFSGIEIIGKDKVENNIYEGRGAATIDICKLNRYELKKDRHDKVVVEIVKAFEKTFKLLQISETPLTKYEEVFKIEFEEIIQKSKQDELEHTLLRKAITDENKFETIICPAINGDNIKKVIIEAFKKYKNQN